MIELILASTVGILLISLPIGVYFIRQQQKQVEILRNRLTTEQIESHTRVKLLEQRYDRLFATQNANLERASKVLKEENAKALNELQLHFKAFKNNFTNNY